MKKGKQEQSTPGLFGAPLLVVCSGTGEIGLVQRRKGGSRGWGKERREESLCRFSWTRVMVVK